MGLNFKSLAGTPAAKFDTINTTAEGVIEAAEMVDDQNNPGKQVPVITLVDDDGVKRKLWVRSQMVDAINAALEKARADDLEIGGTLKVTYIEDRTLRSGRTMKVYSAEYLPDASAAFAVESRV